MVPSAASRKYGLYQTSVGLLTLSSEGDFLTEVLFGNAMKPDAVEQKNAVTDQAVLQLEEYFAGKRKNFTLPLLLRGTSFQKQVWQAVRTISYGQTCSYKDIAVQIKRPLAYRAVGMANHNNPIAIIVPCHRVLGADGSLTGYGGGLPLKSMLLELEQRHRHAPSPFL